APGQPFWVALYQRISPGWHTYWVNPGDSGEPPRVEWALPSGFTVGEIAWPLPQRIPVGAAMTYGYSGEVVLPIPVTPPAGLRPGDRVTLRGQASWLVCEKVCIPEEAPIALTLPVVRGTPAPDPRGAKLIAAARRTIPTPSPWQASSRSEGEDGQTALISLLRALTLAVAGGLVLNLMPCVLPVLSVKALGLVQHSSGRLALLRAHGLAYTAGVLVSFAVVAGALI